MKKDIQVSAFRGGEDILNNLSIKIDNYTKKVELKEELKGLYNIKCIFEKTSQELSYDDSVLGNIIHHENLGIHKIIKTSKVFLSDDSLTNELIDLKLDNDYFIGIKIFTDKPINHYTALDALPIPTDIITIYIYFSESEIVESKSVIQKYFDSYSHLGFFLVDLDRMKTVIEKEYGSKELDLVHEFSNSEIIDKLFEEEIIMIVWGINPYTYPIYSCENPNIVIPMLGREFEQIGVFNIDEKIKELSLVPGHELKNYPHFLSKDWQKIQLKGKGKKTYLKPYILEDTDLETVLASFIIYREESDLEESKPLINVDLLYS